MILFDIHIVLSQSRLIVFPQDLPFIQNMQPRIGSADAFLDASLRRCFVRGLELRNETVIIHCLRAYAAIDNSAGAEEAFRSAVVAPFVQKALLSPPTGVAVAPRSDRFEEFLEEIKAYIQTDCLFLLDKAAAGIYYFLPYLSLCPNIAFGVTSY